MKITTWNVNSLNVRLPQVQNLLADNPPDILVLQELKLDQDKFPAAALQMMGWHCVWSGQKTYNGVAIVSRSAPEDVHFGLPSLPDDPQRRVIAATVGGVRVINVYCVNGEALDSPKFKYKEQWFAALTEFVRDEMTRYGKLVLLGDFNIAPADADCYDPEKLARKNPLFVRRTAVVSKPAGFGTDRQPAPSPSRRRVLHMVRLSRRDVPTQTGSAYRPYFGVACDGGGVEGCPRRFGYARFRASERPRARNGGIRLVKGSVLIWR